LLKFFTTEFPGETYQPPVSSAKEFAMKLREDNLGNGFEHIDIAPEIGYDDGPLLLSYRPEGAQAFIQFAGRASNTPANNHFATRFTILRDALNGERMFSEFWTAEKWQKMEAKIQRECQRAGVAKSPLILWYSFWSDKCALDGAGRHTGHPLTITCANRTVEHQRTPDGEMLFAMLPHLPYTEGEITRAGWAPRWGGGDCRLLAPGGVRGCVCHPREAGLGARCNPQPRWQRRFTWALSSTQPGRGVTTG
jgi:hypothetical protein